jgi:hypothetical protein
MLVEYRLSQYTNGALGSVCFLGRPPVCAGSVGGKLDDWFLDGGSRLADSVWYVLGAVKMRLIGTFTLQSGELETCRNE